MADTAARLTDEVFPRVPVRQWVLSLPYDVRQIVETTARRVVCLLKRRGLLEKDADDVLSAQEPPLASGRLRIVDAQTVSFALKTPWSDGTTHVLLSPRGDALSRLRRPHEAHCSADGAAFHPQLPRRGGVAVTGSTDRRRKTACPTRIRLRELTIVGVRQAKYVLLCGSRTAGTVPAELTTRPWG